MRILTFDPVPSSKRGGQELSLADECVGLAERGHDVTLGYLGEGDLLSRYRAAGASTIQLSALRVDRSATLRSSVSLCASFVRAVRASADVVLLNDYHDTMFGRALSRARRVPLVCHLRIFPPDVFAGQWRVGLRGVTRFIAVSQAVADEWVRHGACDPGTIDVVHDGIDVPGPTGPGERDATRVSLGLSPDSFVVLYAGRLDRSKNLEALLRAFALVGVPGARLLIAGRPVDHPSPAVGEAYVRELQTLAQTLGVASATQWLGPRGDVLSLFRAADVSVLLAYNEAFGRTTVESLACGTPAVVSGHGGTAEILTGEFSRFRVDITRPTDIAALLRSLAGWRERDPGFAARAREHARRHFGVASMVHGVEQSLQRAVREGWAEQGPRSHSLPHAKRAARR